nr:DUF1572 family protein [uncultured Arsenicibacter sp.]
MQGAYLKSVISQFTYYKVLGEKAMAQVPDEVLFRQYTAESNSIAVIVKHLWGNMLSRWTDFLSSDGEKPWRDREGEFTDDISSREELLSKWDAGWAVFLETLQTLTDDDLSTIVYIRHQGHTVLEAINRQLAHYPYHVGQIVYLCKLAAGHWESLSIPRGQSATYNAAKFAQPRHREHFTDEFIKPDNSTEANS